MTATDPTYAALLVGVLATPEADVPRLVLADWLEENGEPERAEFIRIQCELARLSVSPCGGYYCDEAIGHIDCEDPTGEKRAAASKRSRELLEQPSHGTHGAANWCVWSKPASDLIPSNSGSLFGQPFEFRRGFVESVTCDLATFMGGPCGRCENGAMLTSREWLSAERCPVCSGTGRTPGIAPRLFASQPVQQITLSDVRPMRHRILAGHRYGYELRDDNARDAWQLPAELFRHLPKADFFVNDYRRWWWTEDDAMSALSAALVAYGRANAEGHRHGVCETCKGEKRTDYWGPCPDCDATGTKPGLPPLAGTTRERTTT